MAVPAAELEDAVGVEVELVAVLAAGVGVAATGPLGVAPAVVP